MDYSKIPSLDNFKKVTSLGLFSTREKELQAIDKALETFHKQTSDYGKKWHSEELRIALDQWKSAKTNEDSSWMKDPRNSKNALSVLDSVLPPQKKKPASGQEGQKQQQQEDTATHLRKGTLFFLSNINMNGNIPDKIMTWASDTNAFVGDVKELASKADPTAAAELLKEIKSGGGAAAPLETESPSGFVASVISAVTDFLKKLVDQVPGEGASKAAEWIAAQTPEIVCELLGSVVSVLGAVFGIVKNLVQAVSAGIDYFKTRNLEGGILSGQPKLVIESIREQIKDYGIEGLMKALTDALLAGLNAANPALASIASAVRSIFGFIAKVFFHFKQVFKLKKIMVEAKDLFEKEKLYEKPDEFYSWYSNTIQDLPIISCYCLAMPMTGSFYGFLSQVVAPSKSSSNTKGGELALTQEQLKENHELFEDVKVRAKQFVKEHSIKLNSDDPIVKMSIDAAVGRKIEIGTTEKEKEKEKEG